MSLGGILPSNLPSPSDFSIIVQHVSNLSEDLVSYKNPISPFPHGREDLAQTSLNLFQESIFT